MIREKSRLFSVRVVKLYRHLVSEKKEYVMSKQLLRSGTSIGANLAESRYAQSRGDFLSKNSIALKEAAETEYWLDLLHDTGYLTDPEYSSIHADVAELIRMLTSITKSLKSK